MATYTGKYLNNCDKSGKVGWRCFINFWVASKMILKQKITPYTVFSSKNTVFASIDKFKKVDHFS
jgi:hypothetical protein